MYLNKYINMVSKNIITVSKIASEKLSFFSSKVFK